MTKERAIALAEEVGFSHNGIFPVAKMRFLPEVRDMCAADKCHMYGKCWSCPPGCGTIEDSRRKAADYNWGILLQSTGDMEDDFDVEVMMETEEQEKDRLNAFVARLKEEGETEYLPMGAGACGLCEKCTYPDAPCRFPDRMITSMEAYGLVVAEVCQLADTPYYYGPLTITYSSCVLFK